MWISLDDIETLELTYKGSQLSSVTTHQTYTLTATVAGFPSLEGSRWASGSSDGLHSWENLDLVGHFFKCVWSASVMWDRQRCRRAPTVGELQWSDIKGVGAFSGKWPVVQSGSFCHLHQPRPAKITAALSQICLTLSQRARTRTLTFPASQIPSQGHTVAPAGQNCGGWVRDSWECMWAPNPLTLWPFVAPVCPCHSTAVEYQPLLSQVSKNYKYLQLGP